MHKWIKLLRLGKRELIFLLLFTCNFVVSLPFWYLVWAALFCCGTRWTFYLLFGKVNYDKTAVHRENLIKTSTHNKAVFDGPAGPSINIAKV